MLGIGFLDVLGYRQRRLSIGGDPKRAALTFERRSGLASLSQSVGVAAAGLAIVFLITAFYSRADFDNETTVGFTYLLAILCASTLWGLSVSVLMSISATLAYDYYFLPPVHQFGISDYRDWVALSGFLITSVVGSCLSGWARREAQEADRRRREVERLYGFTQRLLSADDQVGLLGAIPRHIAEAFGVSAAAVFLSETEEVYHWGIDLAQLKAKGARAKLASSDLQAKAEGSVCVVPIRLGGQEIGSIHVPLPAPSNTTLEAIATLIAVAIERVRAIEHAGAMEAARESERLKSALLDAITHDFRTPLTSIKGSVTGLLSGIEFDGDQQQELLSVIDEGCDRIDQLVSAASEMARIDAGEVKLDMMPHSAGEFISTAMADCKEVLQERPMRFEVNHQDLQVLADLPAAKKVLVHLIDNANLYSSPGEPIVISTEERNGFLLFNVADRGPGIDKREINRIFEKFYRGEGQRDRVPGTGMGLAIAKAITEAHGGTLKVESQQGRGTVFTFSLPINSGVRFAEACQT
jgi:two-component system, OmpR family, sensor histidine kinase KdpD